MPQTQTPPARPANNHAEPLAIPAQQVVTWLSVGGIALGAAGTISAMSALVHLTTNAAPPQSLGRVFGFAWILLQPFLLAGSVGCLQRQTWGRQMLLAYACITALLALLLPLASVSCSLGATGQPSAQALLVSLAALPQAIASGLVVPAVILLCLTRPAIKAAFSEPYSL